MKHEGQRSIVRPWHDESFEGGGEVSAANKPNWVGYVNSTSWAALDVRAHATRWDHEDDGDRSLTPHNQLWVRKGPWEPATYKWRPCSGDGGAGEGIGTRGGA